MCGFLSHDMLVLRKSAYSGRHNVSLCEHSIKGIADLELFKHGPEAVKVSVCDVYRQMERYVPIASDLC